MINKEHLQKFKDLYLKHFGEELSDQEALESTTKLVRLMKVIYRPLSKKF